MQASASRHAQGRPVGLPQHAESGGLRVTSGIEAVASKMTGRFRIPGGQVRRTRQPLDAHPMNGDLTPPTTARPDRRAVCHHELR